MLRKVISSEFQAYMFQSHHGYAFYFSVCPPDCTMCINTGHAIITPSVSFISSTEMHTPMPEVDSGNPSEQDNVNIDGNPLLSLVEKS